MIERITKSWKSSVLGVLVLLSGFFLVFMEKITLTEFLPFLIGVYGIFYKENKK